MKKTIVVALAGLALTVGAGEAAAKGCITGAAVGGVAGHVAGHHGVVGAAAGCAVNHHRNKVNAEKTAAAQRAQPAQTTAVAPAPATQTR